MIATFPYMGETFALLTAIIWATAVIFFKRSGESVHPIALNLFKNLLAIVLILITIILLGGSFYHPFSTREYLLLLASGALGIGLADTMFFKSLNLLGAGLTAIVDCLYSPFIIGLSIIWLGEQLSAWQIVGAVLIITAVLTATREKGQNSITTRNLVYGILWGAGGMAFMAVGIVMIKPLLERSPLLWAAEIRLIGGCLMLGLMLLVYPSRRAVISTLFIRRGWFHTAMGSFFGAYLAMIVWLAGMKFASASVAAALNQTSNIFIFIFAGIFLHELINLRRTVGIILAAIGAFLVTFA